MRNLQMQKKKTLMTEDSFEADPQGELFAESYKNKEQVSQYQILTTGFKTTSITLV